MKPLRDLLSDLAARGVTVRLDGGEVKVRPWPDVAPAERKRLRSERDAVRELLEARDGLTSRESPVEEAKPEQAEPVDVEPDVAVVSPEAPQAATGDWLLRAAELVKPVSVLGQIVFVMPPADPGHESPPPIVSEGIDEVVRERLRAVRAPTWAERMGAASQERPREALEPSNRTAGRSGDSDAPAGDSGPPRARSGPVYRIDGVEVTEQEYAKTKRTGPLTGVLPRWYERPGLGVHRHRGR